MIPHSQVAFKLPILKSFYLYILTSTFTFNRASQSSTLASKLLAIVAMFFDWDCNISDLVMGCSRIGTSGGVASLDDTQSVS
jgi:hypothetical protein